MHKRNGAAWNRGVSVWNHELLTHLLGRNLKPINPVQITKGNANDKTPVPLFSPSSATWPRHVFVLKRARKAERELDSKMAEEKTEKGMVFVVFV